METRETDTQPRHDGEAICERCGKFGAYDFAGMKLCADCYQQAGSCCPEFGADDLWKGRNAN